MRVIPVIDLKDGQVVRGVGGQRAHYRPLVSVLAADSSPRNVAAGLVRQLDAREAYLADLDAIAGAVPNWPAHEQVAAAGLRLWLDAGIGDVERAASVARWSASAAASIRPIVGLESVAAPALLSAIRATLSPYAPVFSLDMRGGLALAGSEWGSTSPRQIAATAWAAGFRSLLALDLEAIGAGRGPTTMALCRELRAAYPELELLSGGGVRGVADLRQLAASGCDAVLLGAALYDGCLSPQDLAALRHTAADS